jgi:hypothetical protein
VDAGQTFCLAHTRCSAGQRVAKAGNASSDLTCTGCLIDEFSNATSLICTACPLGKYQDAEGQPYCDTKQGELTKGV